MVRYERFKPNAHRSGAEYVPQGFTRRTSLGTFLTSDNPTKVKNRLLNMEEVQRLDSNWQQPFEANA
jgi:hypothetical protein